MRAVSARAVEALDFVREWQRSEWGEWVARFEYRRGSAVAVAILIEWGRVVSGMPEMASSSSDGGMPEVAEDIEATSSESEIETTLLVLRSFELRRWHGRSC